MNKGPTNETLKELCLNLEKLAKKENAKIWKRVASELQKPARSKKPVNILKINKCTKEGETALVIGKVLSEGELTKKINIASFNFSTLAKEKLGKSAITIEELIKKNPKGNKVRIIK